MGVIYRINGQNFADYGVGVSASKGLTDLPKQKTPLKTDWNDRDGYYIDLSRRTYQAREITLDCWVSAQGYGDFIAKCKSFLTLFQTTSLKYLQVELTEKDNLGNDVTNYLHYMVYQDGGVAYNKIWHEHHMIGTFSLKLIEPEPIKEVVDCSTQTYYVTQIKYEFTRLAKCYDTKTGAWTYDIIGAYSDTGNSPIPVYSSQPPATRSEKRFFLFYCNPQDGGTNGGDKTYYNS